MSREFHVVVCAGIVPDPLQTLEPVETPSGPGIKNEMMLPAVLDPWAGHALYEAAALSKKYPGSKVWLVSIAPKAKLQQVMMTIAQKLQFELVAVDAPAGGFAESHEISQHLADAINGIQGLDKSKMLLYGGWESASRGSGSTMQILGEILGVRHQFQAVDELKIYDEGTMEILERAEGGKHQVSVCDSLPALFGWATGNLPEPPNNPQTGMMNMRTVMPSLQRAKKCDISREEINFEEVKLPSVRRDTKVVKDASPDEIAKDIVEWINSGR